MRRVLLLLTLAVLPLASGQIMTGTGPLTLDKIDLPEDTVAGSTAYANLTLSYECAAADVGSSVEIEVWSDADYSSVVVNHKTTYVVPMSACYGPGAPWDDVIEVSIFVPSDLNATVVAIEFQAHAARQGVPGYSDSNEYVIAVPMVEPAPQTNQTDDDGESSQGAPYEESPGLALPLTAIAIIALARRRL